MNLTISPYWTFLQFVFYHLQLKNVPPLQDSVLSNIVPYSVPWSHVNQPTDSAAASEQRIYTLCSCVFVLSHFCPVWLFVAPWTVARQAPLSMGLSRQEYCSGLPWPSPGDLPHPGIKLASLTSPALAGGFFTTSAMWETHLYFLIPSKIWARTSYFNQLFLQMTETHYFNYFPCPPHYPKHTMWCIP